MVISGAGLVLRVSNILIRSHFEADVMFVVASFMLVMEGYFLLTSVVRKIVNFIRDYILPFIPFLG